MRRLKNRWSAHPIQITGENFMKRLSLLLVVVALLCLAGLAGYGQGQRSNSVRQVWEYKLESPPQLPGYDKGLDRNEAENLLNRRGAEGWELTAVTGGTYYFRRAR